MILDQILEGSKTIGFSFRNERPKNSSPRSCKSGLWFEDYLTKSWKIRGSIFLGPWFFEVSLQVLRRLWGVKIFPQILHNSLLARWKLDLCIFDENLKTWSPPFPLLMDFEDWWGSIKWSNSAFNFEIFLTTILSKAINLYGEFWKGCPAGMQENWRR